MDDELSLTKTSGQLERMVAELNRIEAEMARFGEEFKAAAKELGANVGEVSLTLGTGITDTAINMNNAAMARINYQGYFTADDLDELAYTDSLRRAGAKIALAGAAANILIQAGGWVVTQVKQFTIRRKLLAALEQEKARYPAIQASLRQVGASLRDREPTLDILLSHLGNRILSDKSGRQVWHRQYDELVRNYKMAGELWAKIEYITHVYSAITVFDPRDYEASLAMLFESAITDKPKYVIRSLQVYVEGLERSLSKIAWQTPYYEGGLPEFVVYLVQNRRNERLIPRQIKSPSLERFTAQLQAEAFAAWPNNFRQAFAYSRDEIGDTGFVFSKLINRIALILVIILLLGLVAVAAWLILPQMTTSSFHSGVWFDPTYVAQELLGSYAGV